MSFQDFIDPDLPVRSCLCEQQEVGELSRGVAVVAEVHRWRSRIDVAHDQSDQSCQKAAERLGERREIEKRRRGRREKRSLEVEVIESRGRGVWSQTGRGERGKIGGGVQGKGEEASSEAEQHASKVHLCIASISSRLYRPADKPLPVIPAFFAGF